MRAVVQRVKQASVAVDNEIVGKINNGLLVFLGVAPDDDEKDIKYISEKLKFLRIFEDENEKMNLSITDVGGQILLISQFTLFGDCRKGRRPDFTASCEPVKAKKLYEDVIDALKAQEIVTEHGIFGADMQVELVNDGPVTILLDSTKLF